MSRRHTRLNLPPLFSNRKANHSPKQDQNISATFRRLSQLPGRLLLHKELGSSLDKSQPRLHHILLGTPSLPDVKTSTKEGNEGTSKTIDKKAEFRKKLKTIKETGSRTSCEYPQADDSLQIAQLPFVPRKPFKNECRNEFRKELKRNKECTPLSTVTVRWAIRKDMPDMLYRWFILQELCKYGPIDSVIFSGHRCAQVVFSDILSACKAINFHSVRLPEQLYRCFWYYPFMMQNYKF
ncbi:uncharacterized protein LOC119965581 [Scyliorhinus canicula]|uniref:uncharacterized protein LOC119965581 n=1 Tax=Scyliorhinus canicula TaxID=7830 RepID=UPI0018F6252D|nr:uncharacterized protein LOC119965581 [Scyliorhinus canicula]